MARRTAPSRICLLAAWESPATAGASQARMRWNSTQIGSRYRLITIRRKYKDFFENENALLAFFLTFFDKSVYYVLLGSSSLVPNQNPNNKEKRDEEGGGVLRRCGYGGLYR